MRINIKNQSHHPDPSYATPKSAGMDLRAYLPSGPIEIAPQAHVLIPTGLHIALPDGCEAQVRPRSGLAYKKGVTVLNSPGTIDADYRGDIGVILINHGTEAYIVNDGDRIAQLVIARYETIDWNPTDNLNETDRGVGGFGSTGAE